MSFDSATRQIFHSRPTIGYRNAGTVIQELPQSHLLANIWLLGACTITDATDLAEITNGYSADFGAPPFSLVRRVRVRNNIGVNLVDVTAWGLALHNMTEHKGFSFTDDPDGFTHSGAAADPFARYFAYAAPGAVTSATVRWAQKVPIALGPQNITGLQNLQNPSVRYTLEIDWGAPTDLMAGTAGPAIATDTGATIIPVLELFTIPSDEMDHPDLGVSRILQEERQAISVTGDITYRPNLGPNFLKFILEPINNSEPIPMANITNLRARYAGAQEFFRCNPDVWAFIQRLKYGVDLPESVYALDYLLGNGVPELPHERDVVDSSRITDLEYIITTDASLSGTSFLRVVKDYLSPSV
jgi:hypothetical protein